MKITFKFKDIDTLDQGSYKTQFKSAIKKIKLKANTPDTATDVFVNQEHNFSDGVGPLVIIGKLSGPWKKWALDIVKKNKNKTLIGKGYVNSDDPNNENFTFVKAKGNAKIDKIKKDAKALLKVAKIALDLVESIDGVVVNEEDELTKGNSEEASETSEASATDEQASVNKEPNKDKEALPVIKKLMKEIAGSFKKEVKSTIVPAIKQNKATDEHLSIIEAIENQINELSEIVESTSDAFQEKLKAKVSQIWGLLPLVEKVKAKLLERLGTNTDGESTKESVPLSQEQRDSYAKERNQMMEELRSFLAEEVVA